MRIWHMIWIIILLGASSSSSAELSARDVVQKADAKFRGKSSFGIVSLKIIRPDWSREMVMKVWSRGDEYSLILITAPARDKGTAFLKRGVEVWQWVPSIQRVIKIPPSMMGQPWMGSDFTNDDLVKEVSIVNDYTHQFLSDTSIQNESYYQIEMIPNPEATIVWDKVRTIISKNDFLEKRLEYYDEMGALVSYMELSKIRNMDGRTIPTFMEMVPMDKKGNKTVMEYKILNFRTNWPEAFFSLQNLKLVR